jgi:hypothetical protein
MLLSELQPALHQCQLIVSEMLHFIQQVQYYINFEVSSTQIAITFSNKKSYLTYGNETCSYILVLILCSH